MRLSQETLDKYREMQPDIRQCLEKFSQVPESKYFYELCYCILTPQSKAENAFRVQNYLEEIDFQHNLSDISQVLNNAFYRIRFHNTKAKRLILVADKFPDILECLHSAASPQEKRIIIKNTVNGIGMKESSHFLRNIGYRGLGILDRHILKFLVKEGVFDAVPNVSTVASYLKAENIYLQFATEIGIPVDELDILIWSSGSGQILK